MTTRTLITGGHIVSVDPEVGDLVGDLLIEDGKIVAIGPALGVTDAEVIDATGRIVAPGLVDAHRHTWQTQIRGRMSDLTLMEYIFGLWADGSAAYTAEDVRIGNLAGALEALDAGVTTMLDYCHITNTPDHADGALAGLQESGIRAVFAYSMGQNNPFGPPEHDRMADFRRIAGRHFSSRDQLLTLGAALGEVGLSAVSANVVQNQLARDHGALTTVHLGASWDMPTGVSEFEAAGILGPDFLAVHANTLTHEDWKVFAGTGASVVTSPETELNMGMGRISLSEARGLGLRPALAVDALSMAGASLLTQARLALAFTRWTDAEPHYGERTDMPALLTSAAEALEWATVNGAHALGLGDRVGSLTVGKQADVLIVGGPHLGTVPVSNPAAQLVYHTTAQHIETVLIAGRVVKRDGKLVGVDVPALLDTLAGSSEGVATRLDGIVAAKVPPAEGSTDGFAGFVAHNMTS